VGQDAPAATKGPKLASLQTAMKARVLQLRVPNASTPRPYDKALVPPVTKAPGGTLGLAWSLGFPQQNPDAMRRDVEQFLLAFDSDLAPIVGQQMTLTSTNSAAAGPRIDLLISRASASFVSKSLASAGGFYIVFTVRKWFVASDRPNGFCPGRESGVDRACNGQEANPCFARLAASS